MSLYVYGASGHGKVIAEIAEENGFEVQAFIDTDKTKISIFNYKVVHQIPTDVSNLMIAIGNNHIRKKISEENSDLTYPVLVHPSTNISKRSKIEIGTVGMAGVSVNADVTIGKHCIINTNASIDHDCTIQDFVHISPNVALAGNVIVGEGTHIGIGASVIQGIKIGKWCTIGAGAVIIKDVPDGATVVGNPGKIIKINEITHQ
ncbi:acetyltransferase [Vaginella massiliensis]|uniref:acetyltransferase n=1 Tax=Vaginella massiliensis TaxID=1816680 RepID=UPI0008387721|nr:acetyltransferase [Vaginella massiliensis]